MNSKSKIIYHYTSVETFLMILNKCVDNKICFRATHAKYFNDPYEYKLSISFLKQSMIRYEKEIKITSNKKSLSFNSYLLEFINKTFGEPFMLSFSNKSDDLAMWRAYGADGKGVAIGVDSEMLNKYAKDELNTDLLSCIYDETKILNKLTKDWYELYDEISFDGNKLGLDSFSFLFDLILYSFIFKRKEYKFESEMRLCKNEQDKTKIKYKEKNGLIIPFIEHYFDKSIIKEIVIGPCINNRLAKESIEMFLKSNEYNISPDSIIVSKIPYRQI